MALSSRKDSQKSRDLQSRKIWCPVLDQASQTVYRENESQTVPWRPRYKEKGLEVPESVEIDAELKLKDAYFDQYDVNKVKRFRQRKEWEKFLNKICSPENADLQKNIVEQLEQEKWKFREKEIDDINEIRLELARKELNEQSAIIKERMEFRMNNARNKYEELKRINSEKFQAKLEREVRRSNFKLTKLNRYTSKKTDKIYNIQHPRYLYQPRVHCEVLCPEAIPTSLNDAYLMLERNLVPTKPLKKDYPSKHNCEIPKFYKIPDNSKYMRAQEELRKIEKVAIEEENLRKQKRFSSAKSLIATLISGRATQSMIHRDAKINYSALKKKYDGGKKLYTRGIQEAQKFELAVVEGIRDYNSKFKMAKMIQNVISNLEGRSISTILDFESKRFIRLQEHRRLLALADVAERERWGLEAKEAGRRQEEQQRLRQHEEMYKETTRPQDLLCLTICVLDYWGAVVTMWLKHNNLEFLVMKTHEITSDTLLDAIIEDEIENTGSGIATMWTRVIADYYTDIFEEPEKKEPYRRLEYAARLADRCLSTQSKNKSLQLEHERQSQMFGRISEGLISELIDSLQQSSPWDSSETDETGPSDEEKLSCEDKDEDEYTVVSDTEEESIKNVDGEESITSQDSKSKLGQQKPISKMKKDLALEEQDLQEQSSLKLDHQKNMEELVDKLLNQVVRTAENYVEKYHLNAKKLGHSTEFMQTTYAESMSEAYQTLAVELLKLSGEKSRTKIFNKVSPWVDSIINEATKRMSSLFFVPKDKMGDQSDKGASEIAFRADDLYNCEQDQEEKIKEEEEMESEERGSLEYIGILDEKLHLPLIPDEDALQTITKEKC